MKTKAFSALALAAIIMISIFSPAVTASAVYGPVQFERQEGKPVRVNDSFSLDYVHGNYTLCIKNGDGAVNTSSSSLILLNGVPVVGPSDFNPSVDLIQKSVSLEPENEINIEVEMRSTPGSRIALWIEDESPLISIVSPFDDTVSNGTVTVSGFVDPLITSDINLTCNDIMISALPVENGNFSTELDITGPSNITVSGTDLAGRVHSSTVLLDGDMLPESYEYLLGFNPLNPDSDSSLTPENEAGNGISDGMEMLGSQLPSFVKYRIGADPFVEDTDGDGLTDYFELMELGLLTDVNSGDSDGNGIPDSEEDPDNDGLTNLEEQTYGTDPLSADPDRDGLTDPEEIAAGTNPRLADTDGDGLEDGSELRLGTDPLNPDSNGNGIPDGQEMYTSSTTNSTLGVRVEIEGTGDLAKEVVIYEETSELFTNISALVSPVVDFSLDNRTFENAWVTLPYDPSKVPDPGNLSLFYFNESVGTFEPVESTVDPANHTVTGLTSHFSTFAIFYVPTWNALFEAEMNLGRVEGGGVVYVDVVFVMDSSGSMGSNDPYGYRKTAAKNFVGALLPEDRAGVVDFDSYATLIRPLTSDFNAVNSSINSLDASGGTNIGAGMSAANNHLISSGDSEHAWMVILLTDGQGSYSDSYTQQAIANNITVYTIGLGSGVNSALLTNIATSTGGEYYHVSSADELPEVFRIISDELTDTDGDGIPDITETTGLRDGFGNWYYTDPENPDTDGDGLLDGEEAGKLVEYNGKQYFQLFSDPTTEDSDGDGIDDLTENEYGIEPLISDTDGDGLFDGDEFGIGTDPLLVDTDGDDYSDYVEYYDSDHDPLVYEIRYSYLEISRVVALGAVLGEWGADDHDSLYYMAGWMLSGFIALGDVRDIASSIVHGDGLGTLLNALSLIPGYGDSAKMTATIGKFVTKHPHMIFVVAGFVVKHVDESIDVVRKTYGDAIVDGLRAKGLNDDEITQLVKKGVGLTELHTAYRIGDDLVYVTLKQHKHVIDRHVTGVIKGKPNKPTDFFPTGHEVRPGIITPEVMDVQDVEKMIKESMQYGTREVKDDVFIFTWNPQEFGITEIRTVVNKNGNFITSYPKAGTNVIRVTD